MTWQIVGPNTMNSGSFPINREMDHLVTPIQTSIDQREEMNKEEATKGDHRTHMKILMSFTSITVQLKAIRNFKIIVTKTVVIKI